MESEENSDYGRPNLDCELDEWMMENQQSEIQEGCSKDTEHAGQDRFQADGGLHVDIFQHVHREWNQEADRLTHVAREKGTGESIENMLDKTDIRLMGDHLDKFQHIYREWNQEADHLTHVAREKGATWNSYIAEAGERFEAVRSFFDGGVSTVCDDKIKHKVGSAYVIQIAEI